MRRHTKSIIKLIQEHIGNNPVCGVELGVFRGENSQLICEAFPRLFLTMVDTWKAWPRDSTYYKTDEVMGRMSQNEWDAIYAEAFERTIHCRVQILRGSSAEIAESFPSGLDFVFIDAEHTYEAVKRDIELWTPKVRLGGLVMGHDYRGKIDKACDFGISRAVHESFGEANVIARPGLIWCVKKDS